MNCTKCGHELAGESKFCPVCGNAVGQGEASRGNVNTVSSSQDNPVKKAVDGFKEGLSKSLYYTGGKIIDLKTKLICIGGLLFVILMQHKCTINYGSLKVENGDDFDVHWIFTYMFSEMDLPFVKFLYIVSRIAAFGALGYTLLHITEYKNISKKIVLPVIPVFSVMTAWNLFGAFITSVGVGGRRTDTAGLLSMSIIFFLMLVANIVLLVFISKSRKKYKREEQTCISRLPVSILVNGEQVNLRQIPILSDDEYAAFFLNEQNGELFKSVSSIKKKQVERICDKAVFDIVGETGNALGVWKCEYCGKENDMKHSSCTNCYRPKQ